MNKLGKDNEPAYICSHIFNKTHPILYVCREDGDWQFLCGQTHNENELPQIVCLSHMLEYDPTLNELENLKPDWEEQ